MEIICIDASFDINALEFYAIHGVSIPQQDEIYTVRQVIKNVKGSSGVLLNEIHNPLVPVKCHVLGIKHVEPNWNINRFRTLSGEIVTKEMVSEANNSYIY